MDNTVVKLVQMWGMMIDDGQRIWENHDVEPVSTGGDWYIGDEYCIGQHQQKRTQ